MKQETIEQIMKIAGKHEYSKTLILDVSQVKAMLEAAYEAGQRDLSYMAKPNKYWKAFISDDMESIKPISEAK